MRIAYQAAAENSVFVFLKYGCLLTAERKCILFKFNIFKKTEILPAECFYNLTRSAEVRIHITPRGYCWSLSYKGTSHTRCTFFTLHK